jgi:hypothetical protein
MSNQKQIIRKIRILDNRIRCAKCNSDSSHAVFVVSDNIKFVTSLTSKERIPIIIKDGTTRRKMTLNKSQDLVSVECLIRICSCCGTSRKTSIPHGFL